MEKIFNPESVVVVGVSPSITNLAKKILSNLKRFNYQGQIYAVGSRPDNVEGFDLYPSVMAIENDIDLAILLVPAKNVSKVVDQCGQKGIKRVIIESGGFGEYAGSSSSLEEELLETCNRWGIRMIGPNCMGVINQKNGFCSPFHTYVTPFVEGKLSILSQSGGVGMSFAQDLSAESIGINKFISYGNGLDIDEVDVIEHLAADKNTSVISAYIEGISRGQDFMRVVSRMQKPVVVLKSNTHRSAHTVAASHSAVQSGDEDVLNAAFKQVGVLRVPNTRVWANASKQLTLPLMKGNRLAVLSRSGGHAVLAADAAGHYGFELPKLPDEFFEACKQYLQQSVIDLGNPLDLGQIFYQPVLAHILEEAIKLDEIDGVVVIYSYNSHETDSDSAHQFVGTIKPLMEKYNKPITTVLFTDPVERQSVGEMFRLPTFTTPFNAVQALAYSRDANRLADRRRPFDTEEGGTAPEDATALIAKIKENNQAVSIKDAFSLMETYGINLAPYAFVKSYQEAQQKAHEVSYPLALKFVHTLLVHKSEAGCVEMDIRNEQELEIAWQKLDERARTLGFSNGMENALLQHKSEDGWEMYVGAKRDLAFGPVVSAGMGGILTDVINDVSHRIAPLTAADANDMLEETRAFKLLEGHRSRGPADTYALIEHIQCISKIMTELKDISSIELNPVVVHPSGKGITVLDARLQVKQN